MQSRDKFARNKDDYDRMNSSKTGGKSLRSDAASQQIGNCEGFFPKDCLCEGISGSAAHIQYTDCSQEP